MTAQGARDLLERESELATVDAALAAARAGSGRLIFVDAHAGLGKSRLLGEAAEHAAVAGMEVLRARGSELERAHSFGIVLQLVERPLRGMPEAEREDVLAGAAQLARPLLEGQLLAAPSPEERVFALLHGLYWLTSNLAERRPLVIAADDLHWADRPSLRYLLYLAQRIGEMPAALFVAARPAEPDAPEDLLRQLRSPAEVLRPGPLSPTAVETVVRERMPGAEHDFASACGTVTDGNPYLLGELLADLAGKGVEPTAAQARYVGRLAPDSVLQAALVRLARLPEGAAALARATAVLGGQASVHRGAELAGLEPQMAAAAADALAAAEILCAGEPLRFVHPLLHSAIYADVPAAGRADAHARSARLLARDGYGPETVASHLLDAPRARDPWAVEQLRRAADHALAQGAADSAARYLQRALEEPPADGVRAEVLLDLGRVEALWGGADSLARFDEALDLIDDPSRRAEILRELGWTLQKSGDLPGAVEAFARGLAELDSGDGDGDAADLAVASLQIAHLGAALLEPEHAARAQARVASLLDTPGSALSATERGVLSVVAVQRLFEADPHEEVVALCERIWAGGRLLEDAGPETPTLWHVVGCLSWSDALDRSEQVIEAALDEAEREGSIVTTALALYSRSWPRYWRGQLSAAAADAQAAVAAWSGEFTMYLPVAAYWLAVSLIELDDVEGAARAVDLPDAEQRWGGTNMYGPLIAGRGTVAMARGRHAEAAELFRRAGESVAPAVQNPAILHWLSSLSAALLATGDAAGAAAAAAEELDLARRFGAPRPLGVALRASGLATGGSRGAEQLGEAVEVLRRSPSKLELTRALADLGGVLRRGGQRVAAREPLREALELSERLGAVALERRAREELLATGARPRGRKVTGVEALTPSERRVAEMAASGMTNREIAQRLFVTVQAVRWHLRNAYRKLEISSREDLAGALAGSRERG